VPSSDEPVGRKDSVEHLIIIVVLITVVWQTRDAKPRYYAWAWVFNQLNDIEALLKHKPIEVLEGERKVKEVALIQKYKAAP